MSHRKKALNPIKSIFTDSNQTLQQIAQGVVDLKPFQRAWNDILPDPARRHILPAYYKNGKLTVWVQSPVWANWIRHRHTFILSRMQKQGLPGVHTLNVRLAAQEHFSGKTNNLPDRKNPRGVTNDIIQETAKSIKDPELRRSLERLATTLKK